MGRRGRFALVLVAAVALFGLFAFARGLDIPAPDHAENDVRFGRGTSCKLAGPRDRSHVAYAETDVAASCFTAVHHDGRSVRVDPTPTGCAYPAPGDAARLRELADVLDRLAETAEPHALVPCRLEPRSRKAALHHDARVVRELAGAPPRPYTAVVVLGHGKPSQDETSIARFVPGDVCRELGDGDLRRLGAMPWRTANAADAVHGGVAPIVIATGGAVHSSVVEAFAMMHLLQCREHVPPERILVEPCAEHTHTNLRNAGRWLHRLGARAGYVVTGDRIQATYLADWNGYELIGQSLDDRAVRDWSHVAGSWRKASRGSVAGFWFTPHRFWAEDRASIGSVACSDPDGP